MTRKLVIVVEVWDEEYEAFSHLSEVDKALSIADDIIHLNPTILDAGWMEDDD